MTKLLAFGDSILWGAFDHEKGGWVERLKASLFGKDFCVYNFGISCNDTSGILLKLKFQIELMNKVEKEDYVILFSVGGNDARFFGERDKNKISLEKFEENLKEIIKISKNYSNKVIFMGFLQVDNSLTRPVPWTKNEFYENEVAIKYNDKLKEVCEDNNCDFIDVWNLLDIKEDLEDGVHPNSQGHKKIFEYMLDYLNKNIEELK